MGFNEVRNANGNLTATIGTFTDVGGLQYTPQRKAKAICKIRDDAGEEHNVHIYQGKGQLPGPEQCNQRCQFNLSTFQGTYQNKSYTGYSGFWNSQGQASQAPQQNTQQAPQNPPQRSQGAAPAPNAPQGGTISLKDELIIRQVAAKIIGELIASKVVVYTKGIWAEVGDDIIYWIKTGKSAALVPEADPSIREPGEDLIDDETRAEMGF